MRLAILWVEFALQAAHNVTCSIERVKLLGIDHEDNVGIARMLREIHEATFETLHSLRLMPNILLGGCILEKC